jgi:hypothetical protein
MSSDAKTPLTETQKEILSDIPLIPQGEFVKILIERQEKKLLNLFIPNKLKKKRKKRIFS